MVKEEGTDVELYVRYRGQAGTSAKTTRADGSRVESRDATS